MKKSIAIGMAAVSLATMVSAQNFATEKPEGLYISGKVGAWNLQTKNDMKIPVSDGWDTTMVPVSTTSDRENWTGASLAAGYRFNSQFRCEGEFGYAEKTGSSLSTVMAQGYLDIPIANSSLVPYINVGFGTVSLKPDGLDGNPNTECWNIGVGCSLAISENFTLDASLRHFQSGDLKYSTTRGDDFDGYYTTDYSFKLNSNTFLVGVRYIF